MWLGYGNTFPKVRPDSWERAGAFHARLQKARPPKPQAKLAVVRSYRAWALSSYAAGQIRNPDDWLLQQFLEVWAVKLGLPYDVFELAPGESAPDLKKYKYAVANIEAPGAWFVSKDAAGQTVSPASASDYRQKFEAELKKRGWID